MLDRQHRAASVWAYRPAGSGPAPAPGSGRHPVPGSPDARWRRPRHRPPRWRVHGVKAGVKRQKRGWMFSIRPAKGAIVSADRMRMKPARQTQSAAPRQGLRAARPRTGRGPCRDDRQPRWAPPAPRPGPARPPSVDWTGPARAGQSPDPALPGQGPPCSTHRPRSGRRRAAGSPKLPLRHQPSPGVTSPIRTTVSPAAVSWAVMASARSAATTRQKADAAIEGAQQFGLIQRRAFGQPAEDRGQRPGRQVHGRPQPLGQDARQVCRSGPRR